MGRLFHVHCRMPHSALGKRCGEANRNSRLTTAIVRTIRAEYDAGLRGKTRAHAFKIAPQYYNAIGARRRWKHLEDA